MIAVLTLLLACAGPPPGELPDLPTAAQFVGVELSLPGPGLLLRAAHAELAGDVGGVAQEVSAQLGKAPGLSIQSQRATWDLRGQAVTFEGEVVAVRGAFTLSCDRLDASFDSPERLSRAEASGAVRVVQGTRVATGERAVLDVEGGQLELSGAPRVQDGGRSLVGERIVLFLDEERLECDRCVLAVEPGPPAAGQTP